MKRKAFLIDTTRCTACRSCQVACKQWNKLTAEDTVNRGSYENPPDLTPQLYNQIHFIEQDRGKDMRWLFINRRCQHCADAGCVKVCPSAGALYHTPDGLVGFNQDKCIECHYCVNGCPFDVPRYDSKQKITKCHACIDRVQNGLLPACVKACPTQTLQFGDRETLIAGAKAAGKKLYGENDLGGLGVLYVLDDEPDTYRLPKNPAIPASIFFWKDVVKPLGILGFWGAVGVAALHYVTVGPKRIEDEPEDKSPKGGE
ncbi:MAG: 4Fe-4S dicluster domain-containing protein [Deltaproteobacteria bacterium]|nr:4Fe-4S dicluster domain-containing protein [Deltaproteobacteria bacterium]NCP01962.1 4Fe-4S dicluster domain-containing protein [Deltaproteobacteria bacterium]NCP77644.1 4Fe-4S dicluster domain-containing protein [Desulfuromonadales bacterium]